MINQRLAPPLPLTPPPPSRPAHPAPQPARRLEFVINDGASGWDKPNPWDNNGKANYVIDSPGTYRVKNGRVTRLA